MILYAILLLPLLLGLACFLLPDKNLSRPQVAAIALVQAAVCALVLVSAVGGNASTGTLYLTESLTFCLSMDTLSGIFCLLVSVCWLLTIPYCSVYMTHEEHPSRFYGFLFLTESMVLGAALAADLVTLYLFFEMATLLSFPLVLHSQTSKALLGASKYLYYSVAGAFMVLFGMVVLSLRLPLSFAPGGAVSASTLTGTEQLAVFFIILGFGAKAGLFPLHNWLPSAHPVAPAPASALLSGIITKVGVIGILRTIYFVVGPEALRGTWVQTTCLLLALVTVFMGSFMGCTENVLKKRLAYSSISQVSYVLLGLFVMTPTGLTGALLQILFHAAAKIGIFLAAGAIIYLTGVQSIDRFPGLGQRLPATMLCFTALSLSLVGIPPFGGFHSKWYLALSALDGLSAPLSYVIPAVLLFSALLTAGYLFPPIVRSFFPGVDFAPQPRAREPAALLLPMVVLAVFVLLAGLLPGWALSAAQTITQSIL